MAQNQLGDYFIRGSSPQSSVSISNSGHSVRWIKSRDTTVYHIDGEIFEKAARNTPEQLNVLGISPIKVGGKSFYPQLSPQFATPYLLEESPTTAAALLGATREAEVAALALREIQSDFKKTRSELTEYEKDKFQLEKRLSDYQRHLPLLEADFSSLESSDIALRSELAELNKARKIVQEIHEIGVKIIDICAETPSEYSSGLQSLKLAEQLLRDLQSVKIASVPEACDSSVDVEGLRAAQGKLLEIISLKTPNLPDPVPFLNAAETPGSDLVAEFNHLEKDTLLLVDSLDKIDNLIEETLQERLGSNSGACPLCGK